MQFSLGFLKLLKNESIIQKGLGIRFNSIDVVIVNIGLLHMATDITEQQKYHLHIQYPNSFYLIKVCISTSQRQQL